MQISKGSVHAESDRKATELWNSYKKELEEAIPFDA